MVTEIKGLNEECGIFGIWGHKDSVSMTYYGLHSLQHRGQEGAGIVVSNGEKLKMHKGMGLVSEVFVKDEMSELTGKAAIGHVRYPANGDNNLLNVQPLLFNSQTGGLAIAHNGNLVNANALRHQLERQGSIFQTTSDTEVMAHLIKRSGFERLEDQVKSALSMVKGSYAVVFMEEDKLIAALDPFGFKPLSIGRIGEAYVISSETCAFDTIGATFIRDVEPGELIILDDSGMRSERFSFSPKRAICAMEYIYFARPDSNVAGINIHQARKSLGKMLAQEHPVEADIVTGVPDSSISAAIGYAEESGIPYELGLIKNRYVGRTFIKPSQELREQGVKMKLSAVKGVVEGKRVVMIDDSIVRGTTSRRIVKLLREAGAKEVHVRISSPPITHPCYYGIDTSSKGELIAADKTVEEIREEIGADSLKYLSVEKFLEGIGRSQDLENHGQCLACFTGQYPTEIFPETDNPSDKL